MPTLLLITDAWHPQVNGVVRTLSTTINVLESRGWTVHRISPEQFRSLPCPGYKGLTVAAPPYNMVERICAFGHVDAVHISTEGPLGWAGRAALRKLGIPYTSAYHTNFPDYLSRTAFIPRWITRAVLRSFHRHSRSVMVPTYTVACDLERHGFRHVVVWGRGVDTTLFHPRNAPKNSEPVWINVGRVSQEKGLRDFLDLPLPGTKVIVGDGPLLETFKQEYPTVNFLGALHGEALARAYAAADVFVFPSRSDTFGLVMAEAIASGVPVAAYPVAGPVDVVEDGVTGWLSDNLALACAKCLELDRAKVAEGGKAFSWDAATDQFISSLAMRG